MSCLAVSILAALLAVGCGHTRDLKTVAASDFRCPTHQVMVHKGSKKHGREVTGCGLKAHYRFRDGEWVREDSWTMVTSTPPPASPTPLQ